MFLLDPRRLSNENEVSASDEEESGWSCDDMTPGLCPLQQETGVVRVRHGLEITYWSYHAPSKDDTIKLPVIVINGGPGIPHNYDLPLRQLACRGRRVVFYDQGGTGKSGIPANTTVQDDYPFLLNISYLALEEFPALLEELGLGGGTHHPYHIVSDSFGTVISTSFALDAPDDKSQGLASLTLNSPYFDYPNLTREIWNDETGSIGTLPPYFKERLLVIEQDGDYDSQEYETLNGAILTDFYYRNGVFPDCALDSFVNLNQDIFAGMQGPADFLNITGTLKDFTLMHRLEELSEMPALVVSGAHDIMPKTIVDRVHEGLKLSERRIISYSGHTAVLDATEEYLNIISDFLERVEESIQSGKPFVPQNYETPVDSKNLPTSMILTHIVGFLVVFLLGMWTGRCGLRRDNKREQYDVVV